MSLDIECDRETDGRWIAAAPALPGITDYGRSRQEAMDKLHAMFWQVVRDRREQQNPIPDIADMFVDEQVMRP